MSSTNADFNHVIYLPTCAKLSAQPKNSARKSWTSSKVQRSRGNSQTPSNRIQSRSSLPLTTSWGNSWKQKRSKFAAGFKPSRHRLLLFQTSRRQTIYQLKTGRNRKRNRTSSRVYRNWRRFAKTRLVAWWTRRRVPPRNRKSNRYQPSKASQKRLNPTIAPSLLLSWCSTNTRLVRQGRRLRLEIGRLKVRRWKCRNWLFTPDCPSITYNQYRVDYFN